VRRLEEAAMERFDLGRCADLLEPADDLLEHVREPARLVAALLRGQRLGDHFEEELTGFSRELAVGDLVHRRLVVVLRERLSARTAAAGEKADREEHPGTGPQSGHALDYRPCRAFA
jgi:hypothetical protein